MAAGNSVLSEPRPRVKIYGPPDANHTGRREGTGWWEIRLASQLAQVISFHFRTAGRVSHEPPVLMRWRRKVLPNYVEDS